MSQAQKPILIVDGDAEVRRDMATALVRAGYETRNVAGGEAAMEAARGQRPALIVLETRLADICGYELCRAFRHEFGDALPIVFVSGDRTEPSDRVAGLLIGADDYLVKPFDFDELVARVRALLRRSAATAPPHASELTPRELEVLRLLAEGLRPEEIANRLVVSPNTVGTHIEHIFRKLGVHNRAQAVAAAFRDELITVS